MPALQNPVELMETFDEASPQRAYQDLGACRFIHPQTGNKVLAKRDDIVEFNRHPAVRANDGEHWSMGATAPLLPLDIDGEEQRAIRRILDPLFSPRAVEPLAGHVREVADQLIDRFIAAGSTELFESFCQPLPSMIFVELLGLPQSDLPVFERFKNSVIHPQGATAEERQAFSEAEGQIIRDYLDAVFDSRESAGELGDDLIGGFLRTEVEGRRLTRTEVTSIVYLLIIAGLDTVTSSLSCIFSWFAQHPDERARVVADPAMLPDAIEELMRFESPVMRGSRYATEDIEINGWQIKAGEEIEVMWASANVDPDAFDDPLKVDLQRKRNAHIDFATGPHRCLGSNLARMELRVVIDQFHRRIPDYWVTPGSQPRYINNGVRAAYFLPLSFGPVMGGAGRETG